MKKYFKLLLFVFSVTFIFLCITPMTVSAANINMKKLSLVPGKTYKLSIENNTQSVKWSSNRKKVAKVSSNGKVTAVSPGKARITAKVGNKKYSCVVQVHGTVDVIVFAGQSNMMGNGDFHSAPALTQGAGYAYNHVTNKRSFSVLKEPFGYGQDDSYFMNGSFCNGSMVTAFVNAYYKQTQTPVIAVPASATGSGSVSWKESRYKGVIQRVNAAIKLARKKKLKVRNVYMVWMQGENDAFAGMSASAHKKNLTSMVKKIKKKTPLKKCMVICIANYNKDEQIGKNFKTIQNAQKSLCKSNKNFIMISTKATALTDRYFRTDGIHIVQSGLDKIGADAGKKAGKYANSH